MDYAEIAIQFKKLATEIGVGGAIGLFVVGPTLLGIGYGVKNLYKKHKVKYCEPEPKPFADIKKVKLPQSVDELRL